MEQLPNHDLRLSIIPGPRASWRTIEEFALTFDGYSESGSFEKCADIANERRNDTLTELRICLFFEQRRWRHFDAKPDREAMAYIRSLIKKIRQKVTSGELV